MKNDDDQNLNNVIDDTAQAEEVVNTALQDDAGVEAMQAEELQGDDAPASDAAEQDAAATGDVVEEVNPDEGAAQDLEAEPETAVEAEQLVEEAAPAETAVEDVVEEEAPAPEETLGNSSGHPDAKWYVVHTYSGHENKVSTTLKQKVASEHLEGFIFDVLVPTQDKIEIRGGKKESVKEKIFPGYILVSMILTDESWLAVRTTPGVTSFVGMGNKPTPIPESEVRTIVKFMTQGAPATFKDVYMVDDTVTIIEGPFAQFIGKVDSVDKDRGKVKVLVSIFGRETPVELDFLQVQKL